MTSHDSSSSSAVSKSSRVNQPCNKLHKDALILPPSTPFILPLLSCWNRSFSPKLMKHNHAPPHLQYSSLGIENEEITPEQSGSEVNFDEDTNYDHSQGKPQCIPN